MAFCPPNPYPDLMVDIETLSTHPNAAILSIAAVPFNHKTGTYSEVNFYKEIDEKLYGPEFHIDAKTVAWWDKQIQHKPQGTTPPRFALLDFAVYLAQTQPTYLWANSPSFDLVILKEAFCSYNIVWPHDFWNERDVRTIRALANTPKFKPTHNAIQDCLLQIHAVCSTLKQFKQ